MMLGILVAYIIIAACAILPVIIFIKLFSVAFPKCKGCGRRTKSTDLRAGLCPRCKRNQDRKDAAEREQKMLQWKEEHAYLYPPVKPPVACDYTEAFHVVGTSFKNGRRSRQTILRQIRFKDPPYEHTPEFRLERYLFGDEVAVGVYADQEQVGNISRDDLHWLLSHWDDYYCVDDYDILGGNGYNYGLEIRACFKKRVK